MGVNGGAFCAVTTLPPPEQAAVESRERLTGHRATAQPRDFLMKSRPVAQRQVIPSWCARRLPSAAAASRTLRSGLPQDGARAAFDG
ncbi:hypothetical protein FQA47_015863 [Oryzias melastigma]|uniref:Uncharacterized protein n=1 Tax=Oryzias melastigma TaxID=30732 RepID=A0A834F4L8_ORYME|nr:hypothetical protein FQA47_015863 [Oryzias melastigma]